MKGSHSLASILCSLLLLALLAFPASGASASINANGTVLASSATSGQPFVSAEVVPSQAPVGKPVTLSGAATGGNLTSGVQIWVFAGNYINASTAPVATTKKSPHSLFTLMAGAGIAGLAPAWRSSQ